LIIHGETGFLYSAGSLTDFVAQIENITNTFLQLTSVQKAARQHVITYFDQTTNLQNFISALLSILSADTRNYHAHPVLQQI
jgi:hypothetical protein